MSTPNAIFFDDQNDAETARLVELDSIDTIYANIRAITLDELDGIYLGTHPTYRIASDMIYVGDGTSFYRIEATATAALVALNQTTLDAEGQPITVDHVRVQWDDQDQTIAVAASEDSEPYDAAVHELVGDNRRIIWA